MNTTTIKSILATSTKKLKRIKIKNPHLEVEILLAHILKKPREYLFTYPQDKLTNHQISKFDSLISRRIKGEPIAYLTNSKEFYDFNFYVDKNVLIPRPDTELIITNYELIITNYLKNKKPITIIDIGTGSGCIIITLAKIIKQNTKYQILNTNLIAIDISEKALQLAKKNATTHKVNKYIKFLHSDLLNKFLKNKKLVIRHSSFVIIANLPYLTPTQVKNSPSIQKEPKLALVAGIDGLKYYKKLFSQIKKLQQITKTNIDIICEIDPSQTLKIKKMITGILPEAKIEVKKDLAKKERVVIAKLLNC